MTDRENARLARAETWMFVVAMAVLLLAAVRG
jgi:hypothetical protein